MTDWVNPGMIIFYRELCMCDECESGGWNTNHDKLTIEDPVPATAEFAGIAFDSILAGDCDRRVYVEAHGSQRFLHFAVDNRHVIYRVGRRTVNSDGFEVVELCWPD